MAKQEMSLVQTRIVAGVWEGVLSGVSGEAPALSASHEGREIDGVEVVRLPGKAAGFAVRVPIPSWVLGNGVQTVLVQAGSDVLARITVFAGEPVDHDLRAEVSLLRAELDLLKRAFRRHCSETGT